MIESNISLSPGSDSINRAFTRQSDSYDLADAQNPILQDMRKQVYQHVEQFILPNSRILELNAGTGIDAIHFLSQGHHVHAIDISDGMIEQLNRKRERFSLHDIFTIQQLSFENLDLVDAKNFDYVFSNFGGLNCIPDLSMVTRHLSELLKPNAFVTFVVMPNVCVWELMSVAQGNLSHAFRRFRSDGVIAHLEGEYFKTYYHSLGKIREAFGSNFRLLKVEGLAALSPQPHHVSFVKSFPRTYKWLRKADALTRHSFPFNRWADHIIVTFQYNPVK